MPVQRHNEHGLRKIYIHVSKGKNLSRCFKTWYIFKLYVICYVLASNTFFKIKPFCIQHSFGVRDTIQRVGNKIVKFKYWHLRPFAAQKNRWRKLTPGWHHISKSTNELLTIANHAPLLMCPALCLFLSVTMTICVRYVHVVYFKQRWTCSDSSLTCRSTLRICVR